MKDEIDDGGNYACKNKIFVHMLSLNSFC